MKSKITPVLIVLSIGFIILGIYSGGFAEVFNKASKICLECVGIG